MKLTRKHPQPSNGSHLAVLADIEDMGIQNTSFGDKPTLRLTFLVDEKDPHGELFRVTDFCTASAHDKAKLSRYARALLGNDPGDDLETEDLIGRCCGLETEQKANTKGKVYPRIISCRPLRTDECGPAIPLGFQRAKNRPPQTGLFSTQEKAGGRFVVENRQASLAWSGRLTSKQRCRARQLDRQIRERVYLVTAELLEREYSRTWEREFACHCRARPFAHLPHHPADDIWQELRNLSNGGK